MWSHSASLTLTMQMIGCGPKGGGLCTIFAVLTESCASVSGGEASSWRRELGSYQTLSIGPVDSPAAVTEPLLFSSSSAAGCCSSFHARASRRLLLKLLPTFNIPLGSSGPSAPPLSAEATCLSSWPSSKLLFSRVAVMAADELWLIFQKDVVE